MTTAQDVIERAARDVGFIEGPRNNESPYGAWYGLQFSPYCAMAVSKWSFDAGLPVPASTSKGYAYTPSGAAWFQKQGRWGSEPRVGAHVFFRFSGPRIHHVGLVTGVGDGWIETIEANTSRGSAGSQRDGGGVWRRRRSSGIVGYGYPAYSKDKTKEEDIMASKDELREVVREEIAVVMAELTKDAPGTIRDELDNLRLDMRQIGAALGFEAKS